MTMWLKILLGLWLFALSTAAMAQSELTITGEQLMSGAANNQIRTFGRVAAAAKLPVQISAPSYWHERIAKELRSGSGDAPLELSYVDIFNEIVLLRSGGETIGSPESPATPQPVVDAAPPEVPAAPTAPRPTPAAEARAVEAVERPAPTVAVPTLPEPEAEPPVLTASPVVPTQAAPVSAAPAAAAPTAVSVPTATPAAVAPSVEPVATPSPPTPVVEPIASAAPEPVAANGDSDRVALERALNPSSAIELEIGIDALEPGDTLYVRNAAIAVQRPRGQRSDWYWLGEALSLDRPELAPLRDNVYRVTRRVASGESTASVQPERTREQELASFARALNGGKPIEETIKVEDLLPEDVLYRGQNVAVVIRPGRTRTERFVLDGEIDYSRSELRLEAANRYRVSRALR